MSVPVRRLEEKDKAAWLGLFRGYIEFYKATLTDEVIEADMAASDGRAGGLPHCARCR